MLKWEKLYTNTNYEMWIAKSTIGQCHIRHGFEKNNWSAVTGVFDYTENVTDFNSAKEHVDRVHDARVTEIAATNGYVKLEPGQVVVQAEDLTRIVTWFKGDARTVPHTDMDTTLNRFTAAIDAAKGE